MKRLAIILSIAMAMAALMLPSIVLGAAWTHNDKVISLGTSYQLHAIGNFLFKSEAAGQINCTDVTATAKITGGQTTGHVEEFNGLSTQTKCDTGGILAGCVVTSVQSLTWPWLMHITSAPENEVQVTGVHITYKLHNFLCPQHITIQGSDLELTGEENGGAGSHQTVQGLQLTGVLTAVPGGGVKAEGTLTPTSGQQGTYGWVN